MDERSGELPANEKPRDQSAAGCLNFNSCEGREREMRSRQSRRFISTRASCDSVLLNRRSHGVFTFGDDGAVESHFRIEGSVVGPFGGEVILMEDGSRRAFGDTRFTVDALFGMNEEHRFSFVEAFNGTDCHAVGVLAVEAGFRNDVSHVWSFVSGY